jgi:hypothetical protein
MLVYTQYYVQHALINFKASMLDHTIGWMVFESMFCNLCRFAGAIPEVANSRLAMIGVIAALVSEFSTGKNVFQQVSAAPGPVAAVFLLFTLATAIPIFKGTPRKGNAMFSSDAEIINGRWIVLPR